MKIDICSDYNIYYINKINKDMNTNYIQKESILQGNLSNLNCCILILETNKKEGEEFLVFSYKTPNSSNLVGLKGVILASNGISTGILGDEYSIMTIEEDNLKVFKAEVTYNSKLNYSSKYKVSSRSFLNNYLLSVILPFACPDNIVKYACNEIVENINVLFEDYNKEENRKSFNEILIKTCEFTIFNTILHSIPKEIDDIDYSPILYPSLCNTTFTYNGNYPIYMVKHLLSDEIRSEIIEIVNTIQMDRMNIQETLTLLEPPFYLRGVVLTYKSYVVYSSLTNSEYESLFRCGEIYDLHDRNENSGQVFICENIYIDNQMYDPEYNMDMAEDDEKEKKRKEEIKLNSIISTIVSMREFNLYCYLDVLNSNINSSFDPFYLKRAEDVLVNLLKKDLNLELSKDIQQFSIKNYEKPNQSSQSKQIKQENEVRLYNIEGLLDMKNRLNIIHYSIYNDSEKVIHTSDIKVDHSILNEVYREIFKTYSEVQSNINMLFKKQRFQLIKSSYNINGLPIEYQNVIKLDIKTKSHLLKDAFMNYVSHVKVNEYCRKLITNNPIPVWVCCKIYEQSDVVERIDEFSNYIIVYLAYESMEMVDVDEICQDLIINEHVL